MLKLLGSPASPYVRKVRLVLGVKHRPYELDCDAIDAICTKSNNLFDKIGDCGDEYR